MELFITFATVITNMLLGLVTYVKNPKSATNKYFALLTFIISCWAVANYFSLHSPNEGTTLFWIKAVMFVTSPLAPTIYLLVKSFPHSSTLLPKRVLYGIWIIVGITALLAWSPYMFTSVSLSGGSVQPQPGPAIVVYAINFLGYLIFSFITIIRKYRHSKGLERVQIKYLLYGVLFSFSLIAITNFLMVNVLKQTSFVMFGPAFSLILVGVIAYAIIKHRFLDIGLVVARSVAYILLLVILSLLYTGLVFGFSRTFFHGTINSSQITIYSLLALFLAMTSHPLKTHLEKVTDKVFFKNKYDTKKLLYDLTLIMAATLSLEDLVHKLLKHLLMRMHISKGAFVLLDKEKIFFVTQQGYEKLDVTDQHIMRFLLDAPSILIFDEIEEGTLKNAMRDLKFSVVLRLQTEEKHIGFLVLGEKLSGDIYTLEDINVLEILAPEAAVAIQNAKAYEEIRRFNITLREEVQHATKDLQDANDRLKELDKLKDEFVSLASHELRTPMTAIKSYLWMAMAGRGGALNDKQRYYTERAYNSTIRLINLVNDMLNISRIESGRISLDLAAVDIRDLTEEINNDVKARAEELQLTLDIEKGSDIPKVSIDADKIKEVLINLIGNSFKFTPKEGKITISFSKKDDMVEVVIRDTGVGIERDDISKLFQKFALLEGSYTTNQAVVQGTGLGLYICKSIVEMHGGKIWAESDGKGKGTAFHFTLKIATDENIATSENTKTHDTVGLIHTQI